MARDTTDVVLRVYRVDGVHVLGAAGVAAQTARIDSLGRRVLEHKDSALVTPARYVVRARTMAAFASLFRGTALFIERGLPVRSLLPGVVNFFVTALASLRSQILGDFGGSRTCHHCARRLSALRGNRRGRLALGKVDGKQKEDRQRKSSICPGTYRHRRVPRQSRFAMKVKQGKFIESRYEETVPNCSLPRF